MAAIVQLDWQQLVSLAMRKADASGTWWEPRKGIFLV